MLTMRLQASFSFLPFLTLCFANSLHEGNKDTPPLPFGDETPKYEYYVSGFDYENRPVVITDWGRYNMVWLAEHPEHKERFERNLDNYVEELRSGAFVKRFSKLFPNETEFGDEVVTIQNVDGFDLNLLGSATALKLVVVSLAKFQKCYAQIAYGFLVNANPVVDQIVNLANPIAGNYLERMEVYGTNSEKWIPQILKMIPHSQLPPTLGGNRNRDFKPVAEYSFV